MWGKGGGGVGAIQTKAAFAQTTPPPLFPRNVFRSGVFFGVWESAMSCWIWAFPHSSRRERIKDHNLHSLKNI